MGLSVMVRLSKWSLLGLISYNLGGSVTDLVSVREGSFGSPKGHALGRVRVLPDTCEFIKVGPHPGFKLT